MHAHIRQAGHGAPRRIGMDRREEQMPCERRPHGHLRRLSVADFAQHNNVRILPQEGSQCSGERKSDLFLELYLINPFERVLDRILDREDIVRQPIQSPQRGVKRRTLA